MGSLEPEYLYSYFDTNCKRISRILFTFSVYFYENCGQEIHVYDAVHLKLKRSGKSLIPNTVCDNIVVSHSKSSGVGAPAQVYAHFRSVQLQQPAVSGNCTAARIDVYDGLRNKKRISGNSGIA